MAGRRTKPTGPDFSDVTSRRQAEALVKRGQLEWLFLLPAAFGGDEDDPRNAVPVPVGLAQVKAGIDLNIIGPQLLGGSMFRAVTAALVVLCLAGCSGGPPRKPIPPDKREGTRGMQRERFEVRGIRDEKLDGITLCDGIKRMGGVESCERDESTGKFIVVFNGERVTRDQIHARIVELGDEEGRTWDPIFDDR